jgi:uncharacterized membrane protein YfcA
VTTETLVLVLGIVVLATLVRSAFGFGDALVGMPLLALVLPLKTATPLMAFVGPTIGVLMLARTWRQVDFRSVGVLAGSTLAGIPVGLFLLTRLPERPVAVALAALIILSAVHGLVRPAAARLKSSRSAPIFGFIAGILGAAFNTNGPSIALYGAWRGWTSAAFRATIQGYFLLTGPMILLGQGAAGLWTGDVGRAYLLALPLMAGAVAAGLKLGRLIPETRFHGWVYGLLLAAGILLFLKTLTSAG